MPNVLRFTDKQSGAYVEGDALIQLDADIAAHFNRKPDPIMWFCNWMDTIGLSLAMGRTFDELRKTYAEHPVGIKIIDYLDSRFIPSPYYSFR